MSHRAWEKGRLEARRPACSGARGPPLLRAPLQDSGRSPLAQPRHCLQRSREGNAADPSCASSTNPASAVGARWTLLRLPGGAPGHQDTLRHGRFLWLGPLSSGLSPGRSWGAPRSPRSEEKARLHVGDHSRRQAKAGAPPGSGLALADALKPATAEAQGGAGGPTVLMPAQQPRLRTAGGTGRRGSRTVFSRPSALKLQ